MLATIVAVSNALYTWDANGNLLSDGENTYAYDTANRLIAVRGPTSAVRGLPSVGQFAYNGLGDRLSQTMNEQTTTYTLDLAAGLTQVLADSARVYLYGLSRIAQSSINNPQSTIQYFLDDALGSVRQLANESGEITLAKSYAPYGETQMEITQSPNVPITPYGFTGEYTDPTGLVYLRARYYSPPQGRFLSRDGWEGNIAQPVTLHRWAYADANPVNVVDPSGYYPQYWVHYRITYELAVQEGRLLCPACVTAYHGQGLAFWIAKGDAHVDDPPLYAAPGGHMELHFKSYSDAWADVRRMIDTGDPYLFGAALHGLQDYWSHTYEGYNPRLGHLLDSVRAGCTLGGGSPCQRSPAAEAALLFDLWKYGKIESPTKHALLKEVTFDIAAGMPAGPVEIYSLTTSNLFDIWLREQAGSPEARKAAFWKSLYGYDTDAYYPFTLRDQAMVQDTRQALREYFSALSAIGGLDPCLFYDYWYLPPSDDEIVGQLDGG